jgi:hypothetical protein
MLPALGPFQANCRTLKLPLHLYRLYLQLEAEGRLALLAALQLYSTCPLRMLDLRDNGEDPEEYVPPVVGSPGYAVHGSTAGSTAGGTGNTPASRAEAALLSMGQHAAGPRHDQQQQQSESESESHMYSQGHTFGRAPHSQALQSARRGDSAGPHTPGGTATRVTSLSKYEATLAQCLNIARKLNTTRPGMQIIM